MTVVAMSSSLSSSSLSKKKSLSSSSDDDHSDQLRRGPWTLEEDNLLVHYIARDGEGRWNLLAKRADLPLPPPPPQQLPQEVSGYHQEHLDHNSDSEHTSNSCISSTESMNFSQISQLSEYPNSPFHGMGTFQKDCYYVDIGCNNMETMALATLSVPAGEFQNPLCDPHVAESNWVGCDFGGNIWSMDEFMAI
ncbi:hypothetical protein GH714_025702 [Hevea brasiliensis]|uniref:Uncharacterized protein n=1 Tax=Hevea brasiliensis TaxID=3981 RepID=A0A6A6LF30_HEVBR|nr:hypothetical protein GH714_025702 [Hevea brasiliensis]